MGVSGPDFIYATVRGDYSGKSLIMEYRILICIVSVSPKELLYEEVKARMGILLSENSAKKKSF